MSWWIHVVCYTGLCAWAFWMGTLFQRTREKEADDPEPLIEIKTCHSCNADADPRCGSGYCSMHCCNRCHTKNNDKLCIDPSHCLHCGKTFLEHAPGKCLFGPGEYKPMRYG